MVGQGLPSNTRLLRCQHGGPDGASVTLQAPSAQQPQATASSASCHVPSDALFRPYAPLLAVPLSVVPPFGRTPPSSLPPPTTRHHDQPRSYPSHCPVACTHIGTRTSTPCPFPPPSPPAHASAHPPAHGPMRWGLLPAGVATLIALEHARWKRRLASTRVASPRPPLRGTRDTFERRAARRESCTGATLTNATKA